MSATEATTSDDNAKQVAVHEGRSRLSTRVGIIAVGIALVCMFATFLVVLNLTPIAPTDRVVLGLFIANAVIIVVLIVMVAWEVRRLIKARRAQAAAARLHIRIVSVFSVIAATPAVIMALIGWITLDTALHPAFMQDMGGFIQNTIEAATLYQESLCRTLIREAELTAADLDRGKILFDSNPAVFRDYFASRAGFLGFAAAAIMKRNGDIIEQIGGTPEVPIVRPNDADLEDAKKKDVVCTILNDGHTFAAVRELAAFPESFLYVARPVDPFVTSFMAHASDVVAIYGQFDSVRNNLKIAFAILYALLTLIMLLSAILLGLSFATRLVAPIRRLIDATDQVSSGNLYVQVPVKRSEGDLAHLGQTFNKMTSELRLQHNRLIAASRLIDERRLFTEAVLSGVPAAVIGLDAKGAITVLNPSAERLLGHAGGASSEAVIGEPVERMLPELGPKIAEALAGRSRLYQSQTTLHRAGRDRIYNMRVTTEHSTGVEQSYVVTLDDMTDLVTAQRSSAWADVARRIAHEIKNPLTPIQLSAERLKRKYGRVIVEDRDVFDQCTDTIVRQVDDIKRMVDEFSSFARMPRARLKTDDLSQCIRQVLFERRVAHAEVAFVDNLPDQPVIARFDRRLFSQALTNILKNAAEGIAAAGEGHGPGHVWVDLHDSDEGMVIVDVADDGKGFPKEDRQRLLEPYMTTRPDGTGLGLPIVAKILEDHGGGVELLDTPADRALSGACVRLYFPAGLDETAQSVEPVEPMAADPATHTV